MVYFRNYPKKQKKGKREWEREEEKGNLRSKGELPSLQRAVMMASCSVSVSEFSRRGEQGQMNCLYLCCGLREIPQISCRWSLVCAWKKGNLTHVSILCWNSRGVLWQEGRAMQSGPYGWDIQKPLQKFLEICSEDAKKSIRCIQLVHPFFLFDLLMAFLELSPSECPSRPQRSTVSIRTWCKMLMATSCIAHYHI